MNNYYIKDAYLDPTNKRTVNYLEDKLRSTTQYDTDYIKHDSHKTSLSSRTNSFKNTLNKYEYSHDDSVKAIISEGKLKNEEGIREKL